jgi:hypothetical protein
MNFRTAYALTVVWLLPGCVAEEPVYWARADGVAVSADPVRQRQFAQDEAICQGEMANTDNGSVAPAPRRLHADEMVYRGCMAKRGYLPGPAP